MKHSISLTYSIRLISDIQHRDWIFFIYCKMVTTMSIATTCHKVFTILLIIFPMRYITSPWLIYFVTENLYLLISLQLFHWTSPPSLLWQLPCCSLCLYVCFRFVLFVKLLCFLDSTCKWNQTVFVLLCLILLSMLPFRHPRCHKWQDFIVFYG